MEKFQDQELETLIDEALANNLSVKIAAANIEQAAARAHCRSVRRFSPRSATAEAPHAKGRVKHLLSSPLVANPRNSFQVLAGATWEIDLWGRIRRLSEAAQADLLATNEARRGVILSLVASVASSYIQLRGLDAQLEIAKRTLAAYGESR